jgi:hypothetical protein
MHRKVETLPPPERMIARAIAQCARALQNIEVFLDKAEADALSNKYDVGVLLTKSSRARPVPLYPPGSDRLRLRELWGGPAFWPDSAKT